MKQANWWQAIIDAWVANWNQPLPLSTKLRLVIRNNWIKVAKQQTCCGHAGEPGC